MPAAASAWSYPTRLVSASTAGRQTNRMHTQYVHKHPLHDTCCAHGSAPPRLLADDGGSRRLAVGEWGLNLYLTRAAAAGGAASMHAAGPRDVQCLAGCQAGWLARMLPAKEKPLKTLSVVPTRAVALGCLPGLLAQALHRDSVRRGSLWRLTWPLSCCRRRPAGAHLLLRFSQTCLGSTVVMAPNVPILARVGEGAGLTPRRRERPFRGADWAWPAGSSSEGLNRDSVQRLPAQR